MAKASLHVDVKGTCAVRERSNSTLPAETSRCNKYSNRRRQRDKGTKPICHNLHSYWCLSSKSRTLDNFFAHVLW